MAVNTQIWRSCLFPDTLVAVCLFLLFSSANAYGSNETDKQALLQFRTKITGDPLGVLSSWNGSNHFCQWYGVFCGHKHQRVTALYLGSSKLAGSISPSIGNLSFLRVLDIGNNSFGGDIPPQLGRLRSLQELRLNSNSLGGEIPSNLSRCSYLRYLRLYVNNLVGKIPAEIGQLTKLAFLNVAENNLSGTIPSSFGNFSSITNLSVAYNSLAGNIPEALGQLRKLEFLSLSTNHFSGIVPSSIFNLTSIQTLDLATNHLQGNISSNLLFTSRLYRLSLSSNQFTGTIPSSIANASGLNELFMSFNNLEGQVPSLQSLSSLRRLGLHDNNLGSGGPGDLKFLCSLRNASSLYMLLIGYNNLGGAIPLCIGNLSSELRILDLSNNQINGDIPTTMGTLAGLWAMDISSNKISGNIPQSLGNLQQLCILHMYFSNLSGPIPDALGNLTRLIEIYLDYNGLQGVIPPGLGKCKNLQALNLDHNNLNGTLPPEVIGLSSLTKYLGFSGNFLTGPLPEEIGNLGNLQVLNASGNMISGEIPRELAKCTSLEIIFLDGNFLQGSVPLSLSSLRGLEQLNLAHNNLSSQIPNFLADFRFLTKLNLAFNEFEGMVPTEGVFRNASATSLEGNKMLCGGIPEFHLPACNFHLRKSKDKSKMIIATVSSIVGAILITLWLVLFLLKAKKEIEKQVASDSRNSILTVSYHDLYRATDGFSTANLIGVGTFGSVYKGILYEVQQLIAVKVIDLKHHGAVKSFLTECEALKNTRHRNLVSVLSACSSIDHRGHDFKALVYEFMENGSLEEWLHRPSQVDTTHRGPQNLTLNQRVNVALDVALALKYLHFECGTPLVHCDIKPSNVLLDDDLVAHVSDFGIAKFVSSDIPSTNNSSSFGFIGTIGYAPPEYGLGSNISIEGDVYSYGIMLLEMFTGKRPTNEMFQGGWSLHEFAKRSLSNGVSEIIDPIILKETGAILASTSSSINAHRNIYQSGAIEYLNSIVGIGVACSVEIPRKRMKMSEVTTRLHSIKEKLFQHFS